MSQARLQSGVRVRTAVVRRAALAIALALALACPQTFSMVQVKATTPHASEYQLKAAFVYNVISFVDWPAGAVGERLIVGFAGEGPMEAALKAFLNGQKLGTLPIEVRVVHGRNELRACNVVFLAYPDVTRMKEALSQVRDQSVLTIGDGEEFARMGGMVGFVAYGKRLRLMINAAAAQEARLRISSKLLSISTAVADDSGARD